MNPILRRHLLACSFPLLLAVSVRGQEEGTENPLAGHSAHGEAFNEGPRQKAYLMPGCGDVDFPITCEKPLSQKFFHQGVAQLHGFWYFEAERSFRQLAAIEPSCAMAYWGMAMANVDNPDRAAGFIEAAVRRRNQASERERMWIDSLAEFYEVTPASAAAAAKSQAVAADAAGKSGDAQPTAPKKPTKRKFKASKKDRSADLADRYEEIMETYPDDLEAKAFLVNRVWLNRRARIPTKDKDYDRLEGILKEIFAANPNHPAHHYRIHLWDRKDAKQALISAQVSGQVAPAIAHQWHMSGHIFAKLHRHADAAWQQAASARVDHAQMMRDRVMPYQIANFGHNNEWLCRSLTHVGQVYDALSLGKNMVELPRHPEKNKLAKRSSISGYGRTKLIESCRKFLMVDELKRLEDLGYFAGDDGVDADLCAAYLSLGALDRGVALLEKLREADRRARADKKKSEAAKETKAEGAAKPKPGAKGRSRRGRGGRKLDELEGLLALARGDQTKAEKLLERTSMNKLYLADTRLAQGKVEDAVKLIEAEAKKNPNRAEILARQVWIYASADQDDKGREAFSTLRTVAGRGDLDAPLFARLAPIAVEYGYPKDWRTPEASRDDVGVRPPLDSLGPFRWRPVAARDWQLPDTRGRSMQLSKDFDDQPVLVIFYLGFGCLHCVEQLQAFHPMAGKYADAGIKIVAIGSDSVDGMAKSLADMTPADRFQFPMLSDPELSVFKQWGAYDDFEKMPLHGTFLVDRDGLVRWADISYEPFNQPEWLLAECKRLLAQPRKALR